MYPAIRWARYHLDHPSWELPPTAELSLEMAWAASKVLSYCLKISTSMPYWTKLRFWGDTYMDTCWPPQEKWGPLEPLENIQLQCLCTNPNNYGKNFPHSLCRTAKQSLPFERSHSMTQDLTLSQFSSVQFLYWELPVQWTHNKVVLGEVLLKSQHLLGMKLQFYSLRKFMEH